MGYYDGSENVGEWIWVMEFVVLFLLLFIVGTPMYFGLFALWQLEYTWKSYFIFDGLFSLLGYLYVKLNLIDNEITK